VKRRGSMLSRSKVRDLTGDLRKIVPAQQSDPEEIS